MTVLLRFIAVFAFLER